MNGPKPIDRFLRIALVVFMLGAVLFFVRQVHRLQQREQEMERMMLQRTQQMLHVRLDGMFREWSEDLLEEATAAGRMDSMDVPRLIERWLPLMSSHWAVLSIRLGDERGNEIAVHRDEGAFRFVRTEQGSKEHPPLTALLDAHGPPPDTMLVPWASHEGYDPRERPWFSKALENEREEPVWSLRRSRDTTISTLHLSYRVRGPGTGEPFRVIVLDVDPGRSEVLDTRASPTDRQGILLLTGSGRVLFKKGDNGPAELDAVTEQVLEAWTEDRAKRHFTITTAGSTYLAAVEPYPLNGLSLHTCTILDATSLSERTAADRGVQWMVGCMLLLLCLLLTGLWWRGRQHMVQVRRQARQTEHQARKLDKVIGEREVLSREVHHRVKNNLQVVSSLLNLQASSLAEGPVRDEFLRGKRRIDTIALVHHKLYGLADLRNVDLQVLFTQITEALAGMHRPKSRMVSVGVDAGGIKSDQDTAIELGIILCELLTNAYQHAFPYATGGHVDVSARKVEGDLHRLVVRNNGVALPEGHANGAGKLGLEIVDALAGQLDGSFHVRANGGVTFEVLFRMQRPVPNDTAANEEGPAA